MANGHSLTPDPIRPKSEGPTRKGSTVKTFVSMLKDDEAQGLVEYALIIALVSIIAIAALKFLGGKASNTLNNAANTLSN